MGSLKERICIANRKEARVVPESPETLLTRDTVAAALTSAGYAISAATLAAMVSRGGGPPFRKFGPRPLYRWGDALNWATNRPSRTMHAA